MDYTQENKFIKVTTPLGEDELLLTGFKGKEGVASLFSFELELLSENNAIIFQDIIGTNITITVLLSNGKERYFNGIVSSFTQNSGRQEDLFSSYTATMVPWLWLLTKTIDSRIFQNLSVPDIIEKVFQGHGFSDYDLRLAGKYDPIEYCVQYSETDFNFISRLLENEGIYYFFEHEEKKHTLVITDSQAEHKPCPNQESAKCQQTSEVYSDEDFILQLAVKKEVRAGKYTSRDFNFKTPNTDLTVNADSKISGPGTREVYDYPGKFEVRNKGDKVANIRMEEEEAKVTAIKGKSACRAFSTGFRFKLLDHFREEMNQKEYSLIRIEHEAKLDETYLSSLSTDSKAELEYSNKFLCIPHSEPFRPERKARKPLIKGVQTAIVVGPKGKSKEIYTDNYGRVKVQFHWDRQGGNDENSSCWIRVSQGMAGSGWGTVFLPRIGHEVIVEFLEGDPDRPIITGQVYHGANPPPYDLPDNDTISTMKTNSSPGGGGFNEIRFRDKADEEQIFVHAQRDQDIRVENNRYETIGYDKNLIVKNDMAQKVEGHKSTTVNGNIKIEGKSDMSLKVGGKMAVACDSDVSHTADGDVYIKSAANVVIEGFLNLTLKVGSSSIAIDPSGISIKTSGLLELEGGAMTSVKGGMIKLN